MCYSMVMDLCYSMDIRTLNLKISADGKKNGFKFTIISK